MTLSDLYKVCPTLFCDAVYFRFINEPLKYPKFSPDDSVQFDYLWGSKFLERYDLKKLRVVKISHSYHGYENGDYDWFLTLESTGR